MPFAPKHWHDGHQFRTVFLVRELRKNAEILIIDRSSKLKVVKIPVTEAASLKDVDFGLTGERKMKATLRRIVKKAGTTKAAKKAVKEVLS